MADARQQEIDVEWLHPDGRGGGRGADGQAHTVAGAVPGDRVCLAIDADGNAKVDRILEPSPQRRTPPCPADARCGGCDLSALEPGARRHHLTHIAARALGVEPSSLAFTHRSQSAHRARIQLTIEAGRVGYRAARSHDLVEVDVCAIARPEVQRAHGALRTWLARHGGAGLERVELRSDGERVVMAFTGRPGAGLPLDALGDVAVNGERVHGDPTLVLEVLGHRLRAGPTAFYQVHPEVNAALVAAVTRTVGRHAPERIADLYAGIGNLTLPLSDLGAPVLAVESHPSAVDDLRANARGRAIHVVRARVERFDASREPFDVVVLDPPRAGAPGVLPRLARNRPRAVIYVSCNVLTAARDVRALRKEGYELVSAELFDMFPDTHHFETLIELVRRRR